MAVTNRAMKAWHRTVNKNAGSAVKGKRKARARKKYARKADMRGSPIL